MENRIDCWKNEKVDTRKIGIITMFNKSINFGGMLQSYALCKILSDNGFNAIQINYDKNSELTLKGSIHRKIFIPLKNCFSFNYFNYLKAYKTKKILFSDFANKNVPSTKELKKRQLKSLNFDIYICGSDQIWKSPSYGYFLEFVKNKPIMSYSASIGRKQIPQELESYYKKQLSRFDAISVREEESLTLIDGFCKKNMPLWTLDPTLLLSKEEWKKIAINPIASNEYILCYFLSNNSSIRNLASDFAKKHKLKIVNLISVNNILTNADKGFGDISIIDAGPREFVGLIENSKFVFTDSFHASAFSNIFNVPFFVFNRIDAPGTNDRILSLCNLFDNKSRFCDSVEKISLDYIESLPSYAHLGKCDFFETLLKQSYEYLFNNIKRLCK